MIVPWTVTKPHRSLGGLRKVTRGIPSPLPPSNDPVTKTNYVGTGLATMAPYESPAPAESQLSLGSALEASNQGKAKNKNKKSKSTKGSSKTLPIPEMTYIVGTNIETWTRFHILQFDDDSTSKLNGMKRWSELYRKLKDDFTCI